MCSEILSQSSSHKNNEGNGDSQKGDGEGKKQPNLSCNESVAITAGKISLSL
jgi:hypothetical protein